MAGMPFSDLGFMENPIKFPPRGPLFILFLFLFFPVGHSKGSTKIGMWMLVGLIYYSVSGGPLGMEVSPPAYEHFLCRETKQNQFHFELTHKTNPAFDDR